MDIINDEFILFLQCAQQNKLDYMLIGGYAVMTMVATEIQKIWMCRLNQQTKINSFL